MAPIAITPPTSTNGTHESSDYMTAGDGSFSPTLSPKDGLRLPKFGSFRESMTMTTVIRPKFGRSTSVAFEGHSSIHDYLKTLKSTRFRYMPADGSNWDRILKWADNIGGIVLLSNGVLSEFMLNSEDASRKLCDGCTGLLQLGTSHIKILTKAFSMIHKMAFALSIFLRQRHIIESASDVRRELAHAFQELAHFTSGVLAFCASRCRGAGTVALPDFDVYLVKNNASFWTHLESVSISMWATSKQCASNGLREIRDFLSPQDTVVKSIMSNQLYAESTRAEFTCEWFSPHLRAFTKNTGNKKVFLVTGAASSGKTVLARWIYEKLQESVDTQPYDVINFSVDTEVKYTTTPLSLIKSLLFQLLDRKVGHESLVSHITKAIALSRQGSSAAEVESALWTALETVLHDQKLLILVDGIDQLAGVRIGNPPVLEILDRITKRHRHIKAIVLSRPVSDAALKHCQEILALGNKTVRDIGYYFEDSIQHYPQLRKLKESDKMEIVSKYTEASNGSFLWAHLQIRAIRHEQSTAAIMKACQKAPRTADEVIDRLITGLDTKRSETKHILSWVLAADRPLTVKELQALLEVDLDGCAYRPFSGNVENTIHQLCGSLLKVRDGLVLLRHPSIREGLLSSTPAGNKSARLVIDLKEAHKELAVRVMAYVKIHLRDGAEPQADICDAKEMAIVFEQYDLLEYAARYWISHVRRSSLFDKNSGNVNVSPQLKVAFSNAVRFALLDGTCVAQQYVACDAEGLQNLAYRVRKTILGDHSTAVLQSLILELGISKLFKSSYLLSELSFETWKMSRHACSDSVIQSLAEAFVQYSDGLTVAQRVEFFARKEEVLEYLVEVHAHGHSEAQEIHYLTLLAELYVEIQRVDDAIVLYRNLYQRRLVEYGYLHHETRSLFELCITHLKHLSKYDEILEITLEYHEYLEQNLVVTDERRIKSTFALVQIYESRTDIFKAEEVLVRFWHQVSVAKSTTRTTELKIDVALKYSKFLTRHSRREESEVVLQGLWTEIQSFSYEARFEFSMIQRVQKIAKYFSRLEIHTMSRSIYQSLYEHFERHEQRTSIECITIVRSLAETITQSIEYSKTVVSSSTTTTSTSTTISKEEKRTLMQVFEASLTTTEVSSTTISICRALCATYMHEERYEEACEIYRRVVLKVWASIESTSVAIDTIDVTTRLTEEIVELAFSLAICHFRMLHIDVAAAIYFNLFRALVCTRTITNKRFLLAKFKLIINFFSEVYNFERVIEIYRELFVWMPICFGKTDSETILVLIEFAKICLRMRLYEEAATACYYVYSCFRIAHGCLHFNGFEAAVLLAEIYEMQCKWELAYEVSGYLWRTWIRFGAEYSIDVKIVEKIYERYVCALERRESEHSLLLQVALEYYESCVKIYKHHHETTIKATLAYAQICERREETHQTAVSLYQQVIKYCKQTKSEFSKKTLSICNTRIASLYASSTKEISMAVEIYREQYDMCRKTERTSTETLTALHKFVTTCKKQSTTESIAIASQTLQSTALEIFQQETHSEKMYESAKVLATSYKECALLEQASTLVQELRSKVVEQVRSSVTSTSHAEHKSLVFLASFTEAISASSSYSSVIAELRSEFLMYEAYFRATKTQTNYRSILKSGSSLYFHLEKKTERRAEFLKIEKELSGYFYKYLNFPRSVKESVMHFFFQLYLREVNKTKYEPDVVKHATETVFRFTKTAKFSEAYDLVLLIDRFVHLQGGFHSSHFYIHIGLDLAKSLVGIGTTKCSDSKLYGVMLDLSRVILQEVLKGLDDFDMDLCELEQLLADLVSMLSEQKKYEDLERVLQGLWQTRTIRNNLSSSPLVLYIGRSLIQTHACLNKFSDAVHLCYHIRYNLAYIRGALDKSTLDFTVLLSELYTEQKRYRDAMELSEEVLCRLGEGQSAPGLDPIRAAAIHTELLKMAYKRQGKSEKNPQHYYDVFSALDQRFDGVTAWRDNRPQLEKWTPGVKDGEALGCWKKPAKFEWECEGEETQVERGWREELVKRRVSGRYWEKTEDTGNGANGGGIAVANGNGNGF
ncbi:hypothetical protein K491DRAFT_721459 [Lophiostoma macrostomum CBS 122681]|uniref:Uncharacterized protein n=1 Tax=Lophiostoma macrostomum CBS 122681 TaxID=1314788 RepID=A0A6A6SPP2_9PLEO|nr:hypothetical protein K491DRAFT_721459 [Lophiostoma macrostomum CBS 122681]